MANPSFISRYPGKSRVLINDVVVSERAGEDIEKVTAEGQHFKALWDTGATHTAIDQRVVDKLNLKPEGFTRVVKHVGGVTQKADVFYVNILLPNNVNVVDLPVTMGVIHDADLLIGMDIIGAGDFATTTFQGKMSFTYCVPSRGEISFVDDSPHGSHGSTSTAKRHGASLAAKKKKRKQQKKSRRKNR
jgi:predicted aspartyl protease